VCTRTQCPSGYEINNNKCIRTTCPENYNLVAGECYRAVQCPEGYARVGEWCTKKVCKEGFHYDAVIGKCSKGCPAGFVQSGLTCVSTNCPAGFVLNASTKKCEKYTCPLNFNWNATTRKCTKVGCPDYFTWNEREGVCKIRGCPPGYQVDTVANSCKKRECRPDFIYELFADKCILVKTQAAPIAVDHSDLSYTDYINKMMLMFAQLESETKTDVWSCGLNLSNAIKRCESVNGAGACESVTPTFVHKICPKGSMRMGCCTCSIVCPNTFNFVDGGVFCVKHFKYTEKIYTDIAECRRVNIQDCQNIGGKFVAPCRAGFSRVGLDLCIPSCPADWEDLGDRCLKPKNINLGAPFAWLNGDN